MSNINYIKNKYAYVLKSIKKDTTLKPILNDLKGKTYLISGASRGIGYNIAKKISIIWSKCIYYWKNTTKTSKVKWYYL